MQPAKCEALAIEAFKLLDQMSEEGGVYPSSTSLCKYENILDFISMQPSTDAYNFALQIMVKIYYMRDSEKCLFSNLLLDTTYHHLKRTPENSSVSDLRFF